MSITLIAVVIALVIGHTMPALVALRRYDFATASVREGEMEMNTPTALGGLGLAVSRDGKSLLYTHTEDTQSDLVLMR